MGTWGTFPGGARHQKVDGYKNNEILLYFYEMFIHIMVYYIFFLQEGLLDRQELLEWVVDAFVRWRGSEHDVVLRVVLPLPLQYLDEITQSEYLSRKLAHYSAVKLTQLCHDSGYSSPRPQSPVNPSSNG